MNIAFGWHDYSGGWGQGVRGWGGVRGRGVKGAMAETTQTFTKMLTLGLNTML